MVRAFLSFAILILAILPATAQTTDIKSFADVVGKWAGTSSRGTKTTIEIDPAGKFKLESTVGKDSGTAKIADGVLIIPISDNQGSYKFKRKGDQLEGSVYWRNIEATLALSRSP